MLECCSFRLATPQQERSWSAKNIKVHSSCMQMCILAGHPRFLIIPQVLAPSLEKCRWSIIKRMWCEKKGEKNSSIYTGQSAADFGLDVENF